MNKYVFDKMKNILRQTLPQPVNSLVKKSADFNCFKFS